jgi:GNAT superfamily N-acetyltransferase
MDLRRATPADARAMAVVWLASFKATYRFPPGHPDEDVRRWIRDEVVPRAETWVAVEDDGTIVGLLSLVDDELDQLYVRPDRLGRGIGSRLLDLAKERRPGGLALFTFQVNAQARAFYEQRGFNPTCGMSGTQPRRRQGRARPWLGCSSPQS